MLQLVTTGDGSKTIYHPEVGENYHSKHGALQESRHVFLNSGLVYFLENHPNKEVKLLEVGFGTGLNFLLTAEYCSTKDINLRYTGIEAYPLNESLISQTGYREFVSEDLWNSFITEYPNALNQSIRITGTCELLIAHTKLAEFACTELYDVIYFDAFAAIHQPEMWTVESLEHACKFLKSGGVFVTYAITGNLKRAMKSLGFSIEKAPGAPGKREMLRAVKL